MQPRVLYALGALFLSSCGSSDLAATCTADSECFEEEVCDTTQTHVCQRSCTVATVLTDCLGGQYCDAAGGKGVCREQDTD